MRSSSILLLALLPIFVFTSCRSYEFSKQGFMVENDPHYHNVRSHLSVATLPEKTEISVLNKKHGQALRSFGVKPKEVEVLFVADLDSLVEVIVWQSEDSTRSFSNYLTQTAKSNRYLYKKKRAKGQHLVHAVYQSPTGPQVGFVFSSTNVLNEAAINQFLNKDVRFSHKLFPDITAVDCVPEKQIGWGIDIPAELVRDEHTLLKIYRVGEQDEELILYTLRNPGEFYYTAFSVCQGATYRVVYSDLQHQEIWSSQVHTDDIIEQDRLLMEKMGYQ
ncbi:MULTISPECIES: hypothetical protein [Sphingobacterium]|uniref:Lipoprotein n=1 Tax=Sphingobacterium populi TaxID=1812824 RepID=A0ABW5UBB5_9SPHI|nr:hypothetical protein [Sphingobacterium sp. CFCC 11742]